MRDNAPSFHALPAGTVLNGVYTVEAELGQGGYGIVYRARHRDLGPVAVKEYLPAELTVREGRLVHPRSTDSRKFFEEGMERFLEEAKQLIKFRAHPSIVSCRDFFRVNGTAYLVMDFEEGLPLSKLLEARESEGRPFEETDLLSVMVPLLEGLAQVHEAGVLHRDIKPSNILIRRGDERPVLIDFGAAKREFARHSKSLAPYTPGYAAIEQVSEGQLGGWTDMYGIGAVMWRMVAGGNRPYEPLQPVRVERRVNARFRGEPDPLPSARELGKGRFSERVLGAIDRCLELKETDRVQGCKELVSLLDWKEGSGEVGGGSQPGREAVRSYLLAANKGDTQAMEKLGDIYREGKGIRQSNERAVKWYRLAVDEYLRRTEKLSVRNGTPIGMRGLLIMYRDGTWVPKPGEETVKMFRRGADQGHAFAMCMLGHMYRDGKGVPRDYSEALVLYRRAAEQGNAAAQCKFGDMYRFGDRVPQSDKKAVKWYRRSAEQGHVEAQYNLGVMYRDGKGVPQSDKEAVRWYRLAADQGNTKAMNALKQEKISIVDLPGESGYFSAIFFGEGARRQRFSIDEMFRFLGVWGCLCGFVYTVSLFLLIVPDVRDLWFYLVEQAMFFKSSILVALVVAVVTWRWVKRINSPLLGVGCFILLIWLVLAFHEPN